MGWLDKLAGHGKKIKDHIGNARTGIERRRYNKKEEKRKTREKEAILHIIALLKNEEQEAQKLILLAEDLKDLVDSDHTVDEGKALLIQRFNDEMRKYKDIERIIERLSKNVVKNTVYDIKHYK